MTVHPMTVHPAFQVAETLAPEPATREQATAEVWTRHYAARALATFTAFHAALPPVGGPRPEPGSRPDLGYLSAIGDGAMAAAVAFAGHHTGTPPDTAAERLWDLSPELGALNGEWEEWIVQVLDDLGINPADIDPRYNAADFNSPSRLTTAGTGD